MPSRPAIRSLVLCRADPLRGGGSPLRNASNIAALRSLGPVAVMVLTADGSPLARDAGDTLRDVDEVERVRLERPPSWQRLWWLLRGNPSCISGSIASPHAVRAASSMVDRFAPDLIVGEEAPPIRVASLVRKEARLVYDAHNAETTLRREIARAESRPIDRWRSGRRAKAWRALELDACRRADAVWCCSDLDASHFRQWARGPVDVVPNTIDVSYYQPAADRQLPPPPLPAAALKVLLTGSFDYQPNEQAALLLIGDVLPRIERLEGNVHVALAGRNPSPRLRAAAASLGNVTITGMVPDIRPYLQWADALVAPILIGGGTRLKFLEAFASRCPVVSTATGAEGLPVRHERELLIVGSHDEMAARTVALARDVAGRTALTDRAWSLVQDRFSIAAAAETIRRLVLELLPASRSSTAAGV